MRERSSSTHQSRRATPACLFARSDGITCSKPPIRAHLILLGLGGFRQRKVFGRHSKKSWGQAEPNRPGSPETVPQGCACALVDTLGKLGNLAMHECTAPDFPTAASVCRVWVGLVISGDHMHFLNGIFKVGCEAAER